MPSYDARKTGIVYVAIESTPMSPSPKVACEWEPVGMTRSNGIKSLIRTIPDHPEPGIQFRDVTTLLKDTAGLRDSVDQIVERHSGDSIDIVAGIEARGFVFGAAIAYQLGVGFVPLRKAGKLPGKTIGREFDLEYGRAQIEIHIDALSRGQRVLLIDDLLATGGTAEAAVELIGATGAEVVCCTFVVALTALGGIERLVSAGHRVEWLCEFEGD